jgi:rhodanese-related sulfurtransferase
MSVAKITAITSTSKKSFDEAVRALMVAALVAGVFAAPVSLASPPTVTPQQVHEMQGAKDTAPFVLDVRTPEEYASGHVPGAVNVPYDQVASRLAEIPRDKDVVLYCRSGRRAGLAAEVLEKAGYKELQLMQGDMPAWQQSGLPVEGGAKAPGG